eukprot:gene6686-9824_t
MFGMYVAVLLSARMSGGGLVCSDRAGYNACAACCHSYTPAGEPFEKCVQNCKPPPTPLRIASVEPPTTLLPAGSTDINITVTTSATAAGGCKWAVPARGSSGSFRPAGSSGGLQFIALVTGLDVGPAGNVVSITCSSVSGSGSGSKATTTVVYRALPDIGNERFPKIGNLWGSSNFMTKPLEYAASRISLWLGSDWNATQIAALRRYNPNTVALTSINACRLESWPGAYRLDLTNPEVQRYQAEIMYSLVVLGGWEGHPFNNGSTANVTQITFDGIFVDNVFLGYGFDVNKHDIHNNNFFPCTVVCGCNASAATPIPDKKECFDKNWDAGILAELYSFREKMPWALASGHAMGDDGPVSTAVSTLFNGISIGFKTPEVVEGLLPFEDALGDYTKWTDPAAGVHCGTSAEFSAIS